MRATRPPPCEVEAPGAEPDEQQPEDAKAVEPPRFHDHPLRNAVHPATAISLLTKSLGGLMRRGVASVQARIELDACDHRVEASDRSIVVVSHSGRRRHEKHLQS